MSRKDYEQKAYLCIGGPYDGRRYASKEHAFRVPKVVREHRTVTEHNLALVDSRVEYVTYIADHFGTGDGEVWFWRPAEQSETVTIRLLLERYEQANNIIWSKSPFEA
jgi:hypothetical protein